MKYTITKEEQIPFRELDGSVMQMVQHKIWVTVTNEWSDETIEELEKQLDIVFNRNYEKTLASDVIYQKQKKQLTFLFNKIKELNPTKAREIFNQAKEIK